MKPLVGIPSRLVLAALACSAAIACGLTASQRQAALSLSQTAGSVGRFAATTFPRMRQAAIEMNTTDVILRGHASPADLAEGFHQEHVASRVVAARALESYGELLRALVEDSQKDELREAASGFVASAKLVGGRRLSDQQYDAFGALVEGIGGLVVEARKARALRSIVPAYKADMEHLCELLLRDFDPRGLNLAQRFDTTLKRLDADADVVLAARGGWSIERAIAAAAIRQVTDGRALLEVVGGRGRDTVRALRVASITLEAALRGDSFSIEDARAAASEVQGLAAALRALHVEQP